MKFANGQKRIGLYVIQRHLSNKLLAKMASDSKAGQNTHPFSSRIEEKMCARYCRTLHGRTENSPAASQPRNLTIRDLAQADLEFLIRHFKRSRGLMLYQYARGWISSVRNIPLQAKSVGNSTTLPHDVCTRKDAL
jgi:DNA polymerase-4